MNNREKSKKYQYAVVMEAVVVDSGIVEGGTALSVTAAAVVPDATKLASELLSGGIG